MSQPVYINRFDGGWSESTRNPISNGASAVKHFDIYSDPYKLQPYRSQETDNTGQVAIGNFLYSSSSYLMGLGKKTGQNWPQLYWKSLVTDNWDNKANWIGTQGAVQYELFKEYSGFFYFWTSSYLIKGYVDFSSALNETYQTITTTYRCQGVIHPADNVLYIPYSTSSGTYIASIDGTTFDNGQASRFSLPTNFIPYSATSWGNYLALACYDTFTQASKVFLWDVVNRPVVATEIIEWGDDVLKVLNNLDGYLVGVSEKTGTFGGSTGFTPKVIIRMWGGGKPEVVRWFGINNTSSSVSVNQNVNYIRNNRLFFSAKLVGSASPTSSDIGVWSFGKTSSGYSLSLDRYGTSDNSETSGIIASIYLGDFMWNVYDSAGNVTRTDDQNIFLSTSIWESLINPSMPLEDRPKKKKIVKATLTYEKLSGSPTVTLSYKIDGGSWIEIFSETATDTVRSRLYNKTLSNGGFKSGYDIQFKITSSGGASITGLYYEYDVLDETQ